MILTYVDSGVLIAVYRMRHRGALAILDDPDRAFASSCFVRLELLPMPLYFRREREVRLYEEFLNGVSRWAEPQKSLADEAYRIASLYGLNAMDAIHVAAAISVRAQEFITPEGLDKPIHRVEGIDVVALGP